MSSKTADDKTSKSDNKSSLSAGSTAAAGSRSDKETTYDDENVDLSTVDLHTLKHMIDELPPTTQGMSQSEQKRHMARVDALMNAYQSQLRAQLFAMQQQKRKFLQYLKENYTPKHPHLYQLDGWKFEPNFLSAIQNKDKKERANRLLVPVKTEPGGDSSAVFVFDMLTAQTCKELCEEVRHFETWMTANKQKIDRPNSMNKYGVILDDIGFAGCLRQLMHTYISPLASIVYGDTGGIDLDTHHGFIVEYEIGKDRKLDLHVDDSEVTLNLSLGEEFTGGGLEFAGARCSYHQMTEPTKAEVFKCEHRTGQAYLHRGRHRHQATPITSGHRLNLIIWCMSTNYRELEQEQPTCREWCGYYATAKALGQSPPSEHAQPSSFMCGGSGGGGSQHSHSHDHEHDHDHDDHGHAHHTHSGGCGDAKCGHDHPHSAASSSSSAGSKASPTAPPTATAAPAGTSAPTTGQQ